MQDQNTKTTNISIPNPTSSASSAAMQASAAAAAAEKSAEGILPPVAPKPVSGASNVGAPKSTPAKPAGKPRALGLPSNDFVKRIADKIRDSENILVTLSRDPSVDELAAAIGLTMFLDGMQKHTTAIYSGQAPDALKFLQPEGTFETNTDSLQDFIIALSKEKADHLRYKLDGDFVKVYITPYKTTITENDLDFSYGDFNVDLVLALGVPTAEDLDEALSEHGRIMHDATTVDITCDAPGKFAEIEWSDPGVSSVSEMVTKLIFALESNPDEPLDKEIATALLTGIVASTERFSNSRTTSETMQLASKLMAMGADQQLIAAHVMDNNPGPVMAQSSDASTTSSAPTEPTNFLVGQDYGNYTPTLDQTVVPTDVPTTPLEQSAAMAQVSANLNANAAMNVDSQVSDATSEAVHNAAANVASVGVPGAGIVQAGHTTLVPTQPEEGSKDYAKMLEQELSGSSQAAESPNLVPNISSAMPAGVGVVSVGDAQNDVAPVVGAAGGGTMNANIGGSAVNNPAASATPAEPPVGGEPVAHQAVVLPPPPAPEMGADMMPPVLPNVQV